MKNITDRNIEEVVGQILDKFTSEEVVQLILGLDKEIAHYDFTFSVIKSLIHDAKDEDNFSDKEIQNKIKEAKLYTKYD